MNNFNPVTFTKNLINNIQLTLQNQGSTAARETSTQNNLTQLNYNTQQAAPNPSPFAEGRMPIFVQGTQVEVLNFDQQIAFLKQLMNLPTELRDVLKEFLKTDMKNIQNQIMTNLQSALTTPAKMDAIAQMLLQNTDTATQKLMQAIANMTRAGVSDISQYKDIMNILGAVAASVGADSSQAVKQLLLLYLPWLPLSASKSEQLDFNLDFLDGDSDGSEGGESVEIVNVLIRTQNFGNVSAIIETKGSNATVLFNCSEDFPKDLFTKLYDERAREEGISTDVITQNTRQHEKTKEEHPSVNITSQTGVSPMLLLAAYTLIRLVMEIDKNASENEHVES